MTQGGIFLLQIKIFGIVQGVGFRPFVSRVARANKIFGKVSNRGSYVEIFAQGADDDLKNFLTALQTENPPRSTILKLDVNHLPDENFSDFQIVDSVHEAGDIFVSPDIAVCEKCAAELFDPTDRRYLHPFINCTACGPRLTILKNMPYDRERTSMGEFPMCDACAEEYFNPSSRRFDAQPICCNDCGCEVFLLGKNLRGHEAIRHVRKILAGGGIAAIKGIGGFHLTCDAKNFSAVQRLRDSKTRPSKPFAVMFKNISAVERECFLSDAEKNFLDSPQKPIVLLQKKISGSIAANVAPEINRLGVMLPYTPLHLLIFDFPDAIKNFPDALIMTSGNPSGVPITIDDDEAEKIFDFCDAILSHDRKILLRADDSVMDFIDGHPSMIRRSRGYAPLPIFFDGAKKFSVLALGGELKNTFCLAKNNLLYASPYIGDVGDLRTVEVLEASIKRMSDLLEIVPEVIACDLHPRYRTSALAEKISDELQVPLVKVQHHYAHILSCMAENNFGGEVIGVAFDGTGYGDDGTIWGGEFFIGDTKTYERAAAIKSFVQAGGDKSSREGWRIALSLMKNFELARELNLADEKNLRGVQFMLEKNINCVRSTSVGRLFDAAAAILGVCKVSSYEGEAAMKLQACAERSTKIFRAEFKTSDEIFSEILSRRLNGENIFDLAKLFHERLAEMTAGIVEELSARTKIKTVAMSGGVFQNSLLSSLTAEKLNRRGLKVLRHELIPPNDGGICLGQALWAISLKT
ncbi:MAG: carbamoyltransferase HypF [Selenomonadaceae bacterium]|nr:carbamoyltransferase HypF [Selenomonadaceae bacterium]MBQ3725876.1 carbamoyltransferase HypF [Selenomonadaceae bacterium]